jgi:hypothetical protein
MLLDWFAGFKKSDFDRSLALRTIGDVISNGSAALRWLVFRELAAMKENLFAAVVRRDEAVTVIVKVSGDFSRRHRRRPLPSSSRVMVTTHQIAECVISYRPPTPGGRMQFDEPDGLLAAREASFDLSEDLDRCFNRMRVGSADHRRDAQ